MKEIRRKTFREYLMLLEISALILISALLFVSIRLVLDQSNTAYLKLRLADADKVHLFLESQLLEARKKLEVFASIPENERSPSLQQLFADFSDIYLLDSQLRIERIYKSAQGSKVFKGFSFSGGKLGAYLKSSASNIFSDIMRGKEDDAPSIYCTHRYRGGFYLVRMNLDYVRGLMVQFSRFSGTPLLFVSKDGFVMAASNPELNIYSLDLKKWERAPSPHETLSAGNSNWIPMISGAGNTGAKVAALIPAVFPEKLKKSFMIFYVSFTGILILLIFLKNRMYHHFILQPLDRFGKTMENVGKGGFSLSDTDKDYRVHELITIYDRFRSMAEAILQREQRLKQSEEEAKKLAEKAEAANHAKSLFLSNMSHELRTPLNSVLGYAQILSRQGSPSPAVKDGLQIIAQSGNHLLTLINDILDISKIEAGKMVLHPVPIILKVFLEGIAGMMRMRAQEKGLRLICHTDAGLPAGIDADETRLRQVLLNLLGNAVKFTDRGGTVTFRVSVPQSCSDNISLSLEGEGTGPLTLPSPRRGEGVKSSLSLEKEIRLRFEIQDTGVGITEESMAKIFTPFEQVGDAGRQREGTGLGLAIGRQLVRLMGSDLHVSSEYGSGSTFWFEAVFPVIAAPAQSAQIRSRPIAGYEGVRRKILVADDQPTNRLVLLKMLEPLGFEVALAENGKIAVELANSWKPDLILMDLLMPVMNGFDAVKQIRQFQETGSVPMIAVSASAFDMDQTQSRKAGCNGFLPKPVDADKLLAFLKEYLHLKWIYDKPEDSPETPEQPESAAELVLPPREDLEKLSELAMLGRLPDIADYATKLESDDARYAAFAVRLRELAFAFEDAQITELLTQAIEK